MGNGVNTLNRFRSGSVPSSAPAPMMAQEAPTITIVPNATDDISFGEVVQNVGNDASTLVRGLVHLVPIIAGGALKSTRDSFRGLVLGDKEADKRNEERGKLVKEVAVSAGKGIVRSTELLGGWMGGDRAKRNEFLENPLLNSMDAATPVMLLTGAARSLATKAATTSATKAATLHAGEAATKQLAKNVGFRSAISQAIRSGDTAPVREVATIFLKKTGLTDEALKASVDAIHDAVGMQSKGSTTGFARATQVAFDIADVADNPLGAVFRGAGQIAKPLTKKIFGEVEKSAVSRLFTKEEIASDMDGALALERAAEQQLAERGLLNTVENRFRIMQEWNKADPAYSALPFAEKVKYHARFVDASSKALALTQQATFEQLSEKMFERSAALNKGVPSLSLSKMDQTLYMTLRSDASRAAFLWKLTKDGKNPLSLGEDDIARFSSFIDDTTKYVPTRTLDSDTVTAISRTIAENNGKDSLKLAKELEDIYGEDWSRIAHEVTANWPKTGAIGDAASSSVKLLEEIEKGPSIVDFSKFSPEVQLLAREVAESGYRVTVAPSNKPISYAGQLTDAQSSVRRSDVLREAGTVGRVFDYLGLSMKPTYEGLDTFLFRENFIRNSQKLSTSLGRTVRIKGVTIPTTKLYDYLTRNIRLIEEAAGESGVFTGSARSIIDLNEKTLIKAGLDAKTAAAVKLLAKKSLSEIPASAIGAAENAINWVRSRNSPFSDWYSNYIKAVRHIGYNSRLSAFFAGQTFLEGRINTGLMLKTGNVLPFAGRIRNWLADSGTLASRATAPVLNEEVAKVLDAVGEDFGTRLSLNSPEIQQIYRATNFDGTETLKDVAKFKRTTASDNYWLNATDKTMATEMTRTAKHFAEKYDTTLGEILKKTGDGKYINPNLAAELTSTLKSIYTYERGIMTSPFMRTLNVVLFPARFNIKTMQLTGKWLNSLEPMSRAIVTNGLINHARWAQSDEGLEWRKKNKNILVPLAEYITAYGQVSNTIDAAFDGKLFGGRAGLVGGIPAGFISRLIENLAVLPGDKGDVNVRTGKPFPRKIPTNVQAGFKEFIETFLMDLAPSVPLYSLSLGGINFSTERNLVDPALRFVLPAITSGLGAFEDYEKEKRKYDRGLRTTPDVGNTIFGK